MKGTTCVIIIAIFAKHVFGYQALLSRSFPIPCQKYCYKLSPYNFVYIDCCDFREKLGECPKGCIFGPQIYFNLNLIACNCDMHCPSGFKCCKDDCFPFYKICKPVAQQISCPVEKTTSTTTSTTKIQEDDESTNNEKSTTIKMAGSQEDDISTSQITNNKDTTITLEGNLEGEEETTSTTQTSKNEYTSITIEGDLEDDSIEDEGSGTTNIILDENKKRTTAIFEGTTTTVLDENKEQSGNTIEGDDEYRTDADDTTDSLEIVGINSVEIEKDLSAEELGSGNIPVNNEARMPEDSNDEYDDNYNDVELLYQKY